MKKRSKWAGLLLAGAMLLGGALPAAAADAPAAAGVQTDAQVVTELGVLQGDGSGVTASYLAKTTTRLQAAILYLRLKGLEQTALGFQGRDNFTDAALVNENNQAILAYLKANPALGWTGTGDGRFDPQAGITAQQYYKVLLESLGYKQDADFAYKDVFAFAKGKGLSLIADAGALRNSHIATATVEALKLTVKGGTKSLLASLVEAKVVAADKASLTQASRISAVHDHMLGSYLVDESGKTLYVFAKDTPNVSTCKDQCAVNWPIYYSEHLQISAEMNAADFQTIVREDGKKQTTYKGMPLYYFIKDTKAGDVLGQNVNNVWFVAGYSSVQVGSNETLGKFLTDGKGMTLYLYTKDTPDHSVCYGNCETNWPIFYSEQLSTTGEASMADFGTIVRDDGTKQTTYKGWPLYYYIKDQKPGDTTGQGVGKVWYVLDPTASNTTEAPKPAGKTYTMDIANFAFAMPEMTIEAGSSVTFTNLDAAVKHNVVSDAMAGDKPLFASPLLGKDESFTITFTQPGEYTYFCEPHKEFMTGKIIVK